MKMVLDAKIAMAEQEQDSAVTLLQMSVKAAEVQSKELEKKVKESSSAAASVQPIVVQVGGTDEKKNKTSKKITMTRTDTGLKGTVVETEELPPPPIPKSVKSDVSVTRTEDGLEGTVS